MAVLHVGARVPSEPWQLRYPLADLSAQPSRPAPRSPNAPRLPLGPRNTNEPRRILERRQFRLRPARGFNRLNITGANQAQHRSRGMGALPV
jgi:hypothetical protein